MAGNDAIVIKTDIAESFPRGKLFEQIRQNVLDEHSLNHRLPRKKAVSRFVQHGFKPGIQNNGTSQTLILDVISQSTLGQNLHVLFTVVELTGFIQEPNQTLDFIVVLLKTVINTAGPHPGQNGICGSRCLR